MIPAMALKSWLEVDQHVEQLGRRLDKTGGSLVNPLKGDQIDGFLIEANAGDCLQLAVERVLKDSESFRDGTGHRCPLADRIDQPIVNVGNRQAAGRRERLVQEF